ncbi:hypothetical protein BS47DRAFT_1322721 [Hydnum rufescens UP504]|uniref:Uncharacterized protein n=1 Tax=Hydnum rufescens UP504 TaxID=1448309 RepID=A0A9P6ADM0_9AGAM|nr:hypothetical protein BS47DRAFT_1322721 [Hydnum rufescens UP504]
MWCNNCFLLFPLRGGAIVFSVFIFAYNIAGAALLLKFGEFVYFHYPEWDIFAGVSFLVAFVTMINILALSNWSIAITRVSSFLWPFAFVASALRAIAMIVELSLGKKMIQWECDHDGQLYTGKYDSSGKVPHFSTGVCRFGVNSLFSVVVVCLLVDVGCQLYMMFLNWRFSKRLQKYGKPGSGLISNGVNTHLHLPNTA